MEIITATKIALVAKDLSKKPWFISLIIGMIFTPIILIVFAVIVISSVFSGFSSSDIGIHQKVLDDLISQRDIIGYLSPSFLKTIDVMHNDVLTDNEKVLRKFIEDYFIKTVTYTVEHTLENGETVSETITEYHFKSTNEISEMLKSSPFNFSESDIQLAVMFANSTPIVGVGLFTTPLPNSVVTSSFGTRVHPITGKVSTHTGIDLVSYHHANILSPADGEVVKINTKKNNFGNNITIKHNLNGVTLYTFYAHLSSISVKKGDIVNQGQTIGFEGGDPKTDDNVGLSTGHHLHFEIWTGSTRASAVDPAPYLNQ